MQIECYLALCVYDPDETLKEGWITQREDLAMSDASLPGKGEGLLQVRRQVTQKILAARLAAEMGLDTGWTDKSGSAGTSETCETAAQRGKVPRGGIEPPTRGFSVPCSTD